MYIDKHKIYWLDLDNANAALNARSFLSCNTNIGVNIFFFFCSKGDGALDQRLVNIWQNKFIFRCKNF